MDIDLYVKQDTGWNNGYGGPTIVVGVKDPVPTINTVLKGDSTNPLTTVILGDPNKPVGTLITGDPDKPIATLITGDPDKPIATLITGDPDKPIATLITGDPDKPITLSIKDIPRIELSTEMSFKPTRIHNPLHFEFCISFLGLKLLTLAVCGESMTVIEPYVPHKMEICT